MKAHLDYHIKAELKGYFHHETRKGNMLLWLPMSFRIPRLHMKRSRSNGFGPATLSLQTLSGKKVVIVKKPFGGSTHSRRVTACRFQKRKDGEVNSTRITGVIQ